MEEVATREHSCDSIATSEEFEDLGHKNASELKPNEEILVTQVEDNKIKNKTSPEMEIGNNGNMADLKETLNEVLNEESETIEPAKLEDSSQNCALFNRIAYLGAATVNAPRSENEIARNMAIMRQSSGQPIPITLSIPNNCDGSVVLYEAESNTEMARHPIHRIIFLSLGPAGTLDSNCFAFTCPRGDSDETAIFQCHVFRCEIIEAIPKVMCSFKHAFRKPEPSAPISTESSTATSPTELTNHRLTFELTLEIKEEDTKGNYSPVPKDRNFFKIRAGIEKKIVITVVQINDSLELPIERCFGLLVSPGRHVKHSDMHLLEMVSMGTSNTPNNPQESRKSAYVISGHWDPNEPVFGLLNRESSKDIGSVYMTIAVDLVIRGISEPVRFIIETRTKVFGHNERFWYYSQKQMTLQFAVHVTEVRDPPPNSSTYDPVYRVVEICNEGEIERPSKGLGMGMALSLNLSSTLSTLTGSTFGSLNSPTPILNDTVKEDELSSDNDEPLLSGSGEVSKDCSELELASWAEVLHMWGTQPGDTRPKQLKHLVRRGIPEALRGEVWLRLADCSADTSVMDAYRVLITKECSADPVIMRDIHRTFPAHDFFKDSGGLGQEALAKISRAYAVYDQEVGYCQGLSFLAASLLLHMPEEQAFSVMVRVMFHYGLRDLFKDGFETLHLRLYQLDRLIEEYLPDLWNHLVENCIENHMYASQWFLTLFTAKFPLFLVFHILDVFLYQGMETIFQVALGLLSMAKKDLLSLNFEGILKYFRVQLPKRYRNEVAARQLMKLTSSFKLRKLKKYEKDFVAIKEQEQAREDPVVRLERENKHLHEANLRLERESDDLAQELITSKIGLRSELDAAEEKADSYFKELQTLRRLQKEVEEDRNQIQNETIKVKEMLQREVQRAEEEGRRSQTIIADYKLICSKLTRRLEGEQSRAKEVFERLQCSLSDSPNYSGLLDDVISLIRSEQSSPDLQETGNLVCEFKPRSPASAQSQLENQVRQLELELAQTKLALVEAECRNQDLTHQLTTISMEMQSQSRNSWLQKTLSSIKEVTAKKDGIPVVTTATASSTSPSSATNATGRKDSSSSDK
ncbi:rab GTPase-activating protein 1-like isoform X3 [Daphnia pulex]|uniref:rab GTPase-activating protein 1-like isoform X3 n=1 Tax=Daphnia pulex TaxID=6669 RepID=UPI001EDEA739|nr:rab GTPase-activating protein 1-like isoform X3 [Daphnia pulex]